MFKWVSWVIRMGATALLLSFLCIWTTGYIVNSYMETVIKQLDLPIEMQPFALTGVWGKLWGAEKSPKVEVEASTQKPSTDKSKEESTTQSDTRNSEQSSEAPANNDDSDQVNSEATPDEKDAADLGSEASPSPDDGNVDTIPVFNGEAGSQQLTDEQRQSLYALVVSKLNQEQLKQLSDALQGGLTDEELSEMQGMLKSALTEQEYSQMMALLDGNKQTNSEAPLE
jgi:hypothetical protein